MIINDAYKEPLFNKDSDIMNNFWTKTMLCIPIIDQFDKVIGACQAINKKGKSAFDSDDVCLLKSLATNAGIILRNAMQFDESVLLQHHFKQLVIQGSKFMTEKKIASFMIQAEKTLNNQFDINESWIYFVDTAQAKIFRYDHKN